MSNEVVYLALGIDEEGHQEVLGFWVFGSDGESACSWREILFTLKKRGLTEPLLVVGDGLTGLPEAVKEVPQCRFPELLPPQDPQRLTEGEKEG